MLNLFDTQTGFKGNHKGGHDKPRAADEIECKAYARWLANRAGIGTEWGEVRLHYRTTGRGAGARRICVGATFSSRNDPRFEIGGVSVIFPGSNQVARVTMETLSDSGEVLSSSTLPVEPKKGGVIWKAAEVRAACGKVKKGQPPVADVMPTETQSEPEATMTAPEPANAPSAPEIVPVAQSEGEADPASAILARLDALEATIATLPAQSSATPIGEAERPKRTAAHERAVRRAWAERKARREGERALLIAERETDYQRNLRDVAREQLFSQEQMQQKGRAMETLWGCITGTWGALERSEHKRRAGSARARRMLLAARKRMAAQGEQLATARLECEAAQEAARVTLQEATDARQGQQAARAELTRLRADMADNSQPERASDIARLVRERDEARTANAALQDRCKRVEAARDVLADAVEKMGTRVANAEAAVRRMQAAA